MNNLKITNLTKTYPNGVRTMDNISLEISNGMFGLLGPNGAGKSSLMRTIAALQKPDAGSIEFNGVDILKDPMFVRRNLGYLPQEFGVYPRIAAYRLLDHLASLKGTVNAKQRKEQIDMLLEQTNLQEHRNKAVHNFSGGMRQRFGIAQALLGNPRLILVDEPTAGLDPEERNRFNNLLSEIGEQVIVVLSTHIVEDVRDLCTHMAIIANGRVLKTGDPEKLIEELGSNTWTKTIARAELESYKNNMQVISSRLNAGRLNIHVYSTVQPGEGFSPIVPGLEDVYFSTLFDNSLKETIHA